MMYVTSTNTRDETSKNCGAFIICKKDSIKPVQLERIKRSKRTSSNFISIEKEEEEDLGLADIIHSVLSFFTRKSQPQSQELVPA